MSQFILRLIVLLGLAGTFSSYAQRTQEVLIESYREAFGQANGPNADEIRYWMGRGDWQNKQDMIRFHLMGLQSNGGLQDKAVRAAYLLNGQDSPRQNMVDYWKGQLARQPRVVAQLAQDMSAWGRQRMSDVSASYRQAFGRSAIMGEVSYWGTRTDWADVGALCELHRQYIRGNAGAQDEVITNSYLAAFRRHPIAGELAFWRPLVQQNGYLFSELETAHRNWIAQNVTPARNNPQIMAALDQKGYAMDSVGNIMPKQVLAATGAGIVAAGAGNIVAAGAGNIVAAGGGNVLPSGAGNIIAAGTWAISGNDLISKGGAGVVIGLPPAH